MLAKTRVDGQRAALLMNRLGPRVAHLVELRRRVLFRVAVSVQFAIEIVRFDYCRRRGRYRAGRHLFIRVDRVERYSICLLLLIALNGQRACQSAHIILYRFVRSIYNYRENSTNSIFSFSV
jgi:hypothetical protein